MRVLSTSLPPLVVFAAFAMGCPPEDEPEPEPEPEDECVLDLNFDTTGAETLPADRPGQGVLCPSFDIDYWAVDVADAGTILRLTLTMPTPLTRVNPAYKIIKDNGTAEGEPTPFAGEDPQRSQGEATNFTAAHRLEEAGRYYVLVQDARFVDNNFDITNPYSLTVELLPDPDANEPNNSDDAATPVVGTTAAGQIATTGDEDWYAVNVPGGAQIVDVTVTAPAGGSVTHLVSLVAADGLTDLAAAPLTAGAVAGTLSTRLRVRAESNAVTYLRVRDDDGADADLDPAVGAYTVSITVLANPDANETEAGNDEPETATGVSSGAVITGSLATTADQDLFRIAGGGNTSVANPKVVIVTLETTTAITEDFQPQITIIGVDPEIPANQQNCNDACELCDGSKCKESRLQRFVRQSPFRTAYPLRDTQSVLIVVNEAGDDAFDETGTYTLRVEVIDDPDPGEAGDDFLIPNLEFAGFANGDDLRDQYSRSVGRARVLNTTFGADIPLVPVPEPIDGIADSARNVIDCSDPGVSSQRLTLTGRLTYEGDRDYFRFETPEQAYFAVTMTYSAQGAAQTPVELALFLHNGDGRVIANTLEAEQTKPGCLSTIDEPGDDEDTGCPAGSICVDENCWAESLTNSTFNNRVFPDAANECSFISPFDGPPYVIEVVDNGINDFDPNVTYTVNVDVECGCPVECNVGGGLTTRCQGMPDPT